MKLTHMPKIQRMNYIRHQLSRLNTTESEHEAILARRAAEAKERLRRQDVMFSTFWGCTLGAAPPWSPADDTDRAD